MLTGYFLSGQKVNLHVFDILLYTSLPSVVFLLPLAYGSDDYVNTIAAVEDLGIARILLLTTACSVMAFSYNTITMLLIQFTSSIYLAVAAGFKAVPVIAFSFLVFHQRVTPLSTIGILISCLAFSANSYITYLEKKQEMADPDCPGEKYQLLVEDSATKKTVV